MKDRFITLAAKLRLSRALDIVILIEAVTSMTALVLLAVLVYIHGSESVLINQIISSHATDIAGQQQQVATTLTKLDQLFLRHFVVLLLLITLSGFATSIVGGIAVVSMRIQKERAQRPPKKTSTIWTLAICGAALVMAVGVLYFLERFDIFMDAYLHMVDPSIADLPSINPGSRSGAGS